MADLKIAQENVIPIITYGNLRGSLVYLTPVKMTVKLRLKKIVRRLFRKQPILCNTLLFAPQGRIEASKPIGIAIDKTTVKLIGH